MNERIFLSQVKNDFNDYQVEDIVIKFNQQYNDSIGEPMELYGVPVTYDGRNIIVCTTQAFYEEGFYIGFINVDNINKFIFKGEGLMSEMHTSTQYCNILYQIMYDVLDGKIRQDYDGLYSGCYDKIPDMINMINDQDLVFLSSNLNIKNIVVSVIY